MLQISLQKLFAYFKNSFHVVFVCTSKKMENHMCELQAFHHSAGEIESKLPSNQQNCLLMNYGNLTEAFYSFTLQLISQVDASYFLAVLNMFFWLWRLVVGRKNILGILLVLLFKCTAAVKELGLACLHQVKQFSKHDTYKISPLSLRGIGLPQCILFKA